MASGGLVVVCVLFLLASFVPPSDGIERPPLPEFQGMATWSVEGHGNLDGACGYGDNVAKNVPFMDLVAGFGTDTSFCGRCYRIICTGHPACSDKGVRITVTDTCLAAECTRGGSKVFNLTGYAFGSMAKTGRFDELCRDVGLVAVRYKWEDCYYSPLPPKINFPAFRIDPAATNEDFALTVIYVEGMGTWGQVMVHLQNAGNETWHQMYFVEEPGVGVNKWSMSKVVVVAPMSIRVTERWYTRKLIKTIADDVIPVGWKPGQTYYRQTATAA